MCVVTKEGVRNDVIIKEAEHSLFLSNHSNLCGLQC